MLDGGMLRGGRIKYCISCVLLMIIFPIDSSAQIWVGRYNGPGNGPDGAYALAVSNAGDVYVTGWSQGSGTSTDYATIKYHSSTGARDNVFTRVKGRYLGATIFAGPLQLPEDKTCRVFHITGRVVTPEKMRPGIYFIEVDEKIVQKVIKVR